MDAVQLRRCFLLDPELAFLNHGSFGACPRPVFDAYQGWQRQLERNPVDLLARRLEGLLAGARAALAQEVGAPVEDLVFVPNATTGVNVAAASLELRPGDEVLGTDHEYGACEMAWQRACQRAGASYRRISLPLPLEGPQELAARVEAAFGPRTRALLVSHVSSPTALVLPVEEICRRCREHGVLSIVDGAHAPGQLPLRLGDLGADVYTGNCHKWLCAPKGAAFLYVRPEQQEWMGSAIVSWGWEPGHSFQSRNAWQGTDDPSAYLAVPDAVAFHRRHLAGAGARRARSLVLEARRRVAGLTGLEPICGEEAVAQMAALPVPDCDVDAVARGLLDEHAVEVQAVRWSGRPFLRVSCTAYTQEWELERLLNALAGIREWRP